MITTDDTQVGMDEVAGLAASGNVSESVELSAPSSAGPYYYGACVDAVTDETNTENNCSQAVEVTVLETAAAAGPNHPGPSGGVALGERRQSGCRSGLQLLGDGAQHGRRGLRPPRRCAITARRTI